MHLREFVRFGLLCSYLLLLGTSSYGQSCGGYSVGEDVCLASPASNPGDIWIRDSNGNTTGEEWPDLTEATVYDFSSNCNYAAVSSDYGSGWVSTVVVTDESNCGGGGGDGGGGGSADCSSSSDCEAMAKSYALSGKSTLSYTQARTNMFQNIDNIGGAVITVYSRSVQSIPSSGLPDANVVNTEHTWPQSKLGSAYSVARTDIYHLFPAQNSVNSTRANYPFTDCSNGGTSSYAVCGSAFEPPNVHKGVVARAMFYIAVTYGLDIGAQEEAILREWHWSFPVSSSERSRASKIRSIQGNRNPFIDNPEWVDLISNF